MITLIPYAPDCEAKTLARIAQFFGFHAELVSAGNGDYAPTDETRGTLEHWQSGPNVLYVISDYGQDVGFLHLCYRGEIVAWIEDIFVDPDRRGRGIASAAIAQAERIVRQSPGYTAICMDVAPRNIDAMKLYYWLGYVDISMITVRKEFGQSRRDRPIDLLGLEFRY